MINNCFYCWQVLHFWRKVTRTNSKGNLYTNKICTEPSLTLESPSSFPWQSLFIANITNLNYLCLFLATNWWTSRLSWRRVVVSWQNHIASPFYTLNFINDLFSVKIQVFTEISFEIFTGKTVSFVINKIRFITGNVAFNFYTTA